MSFGKKRRHQRVRISHERKSARNRIWEDPTIIERLFRDEEWQQYKSDIEGEVPSSKMEVHIEQEIETQSRRQQILERRFRRSNHIIQIGIAAALFIFLSFHFWPLQEPIDERRLVEHNPLIAPDWTTVSNETATVDTVKLPDRSTVYLYRHSSIRYLAVFSEDSRDIYLDGKAFFEVQKDVTKPFSVYASDTKTTALGTSFTIDARREKQHMEVELHTGKIVVASTADIPTFEKVFLDRQGASLLLDANMRVVQLEPARTEKTTRLTETATPTMTGSQLYMENIPLPDVFATLEQAYQTAIHIQDKHSRTIQYTGIIDPEKETLADVLAVICLINDLDYDRKEDGSFYVFSRKAPVVDSIATEHFEEQ
ncbi:FecR family protein [Sphingobacterium sp. SGR-19]|uniref:FecR family protein n=1 Tax=Sphingobacterium sp. SGR-19 TaxID=2710886 RepID=UPI0013ECCC08|nr:FecR family protein [Sphingobacterium sp. SGR-19]NGM66496.1 FecR family protein [Sphingobacterium sp. SGR-19]